MPSNLPPGVNAGMIPGNRPEDDEWDKLFDWLTATGLEPIQIRYAVNLKYTEAAGAANADERNREKGA